MSKNNVSIVALLLVLLLPVRSMATLMITGGSWTSNGLPATVTDPDITISGTFVIDVDATFDNCPAIKMAAGAQILVNDGIIFTADNSHFYTAGNYMWKGIAMLGTSLSGGFIKMKKTTVEDALCAIEGIDWLVGANQSNFSFELYQVRFNRNLFSLRKGATYDTYLTGATNIVHSAEVSCVDDLDAATPVPVNLKAGAPYTKPCSGFSFQQVDEVFIGHLHPLSGYVNFSHLNNGVFARHCKLNVVNSSFTEIKPYDTYSPSVPSIAEAYGVGLYSYFTANFNPAKVRYFLPYYRIAGSYFTNSMKGIFCRDAHDVLINAGHFSNLHTAVSFPGWKVRMPGSVPGRFKIINSDIAACNQGIMGYGNNFTTTDISDNEISVHYPPYDYGYPGLMLYSTAISINPATPASSGTTTISNNTIDAGDIGIDLNMAEKVSVRDNTIHFSPYTAFTPLSRFTLQREGIYIFGGQANDIRANAIKGTAGLYTASPGPAHFGTAYELQGGVRTIGSPANSITCNNTGELYSAFHFGGACTNTSLLNNNLETGRNFVTGLFMETWGGGGGLISQQGTSGGAAHFNSFDGNYNYPGGYKTVCDAGTDGRRSPFLYTSGSTPTPSPNIGLGISPISILGTASPSISSVPCAPPLRITGQGNTGSIEEPIDQVSLDWAFAIAADSLYGPEPFTPFLRFQSQGFLYAYLAQRPALRAAYAGLNTFYTTAASSPVALLYAADSIMREADTTAGPDSLHVAMAVSVLSGIGSNIPFAGLEAELRSLCLGKLLVDSAAYDSTERARLEYLATLCPGVEGMGVYLARNLVRGWRDTLYSDDTACTAAGWGTMRTSGAGMWGAGSLPAATQTGKALQSRMAPNPASGTTRIFLDHPLGYDTEVRLYSTEGRMVQSFILPKGKGQHIVDIRTLPSGLYLYVNDDVTIKGKLLVQ